MTDREEVIQELICCYCDRKISKWNRPQGICLRCAKYGKPHVGDTRRRKSDASRGPRNYGWKESNASYDAVHKWIYSELGKATFCSNDETHKSKVYHWANISGKYKRDVNDYKPLCVPCHSKYDMTEDRRRFLKENSEKAKPINRKRVLQYTKGGDFVREYSSVEEAADGVGISQKRISDALNGWKKSIRGYVWRFADPMQEAMRIKRVTKNKERYLAMARRRNERYRNRNRTIENTKKAGS